MNNKNNSFSKEYKETLEIYKRLHLNGTELDSAQNTFDGRSLKFFFHSIKQVIDLTKSNSIIDFGCGKAKYYFEEIAINNKPYSDIINYWNINDVYLYDPGVKNFSKYPTRKADGVICVDVVEHIPESDVISFIEELFKLANKFVFIVIACYHAKKTLPDGRNVHLCVKSANEWKKIIRDIRPQFLNISPYVICATKRREFVAVS
ncbi:class I SAM-dependent methyltransferase [Pelagibacteraceae bacterium]|nr:class I SAM-dependent methyltransferase [Pelagibacteraceae bacterium]